MGRNFRGIKKEELSARLKGEVKPYIYIVLCFNTHSEEIDLETSETLYTLQKREREREQ